MRFTFEVPGKPVPQGSMRALGPGRMVHSNRANLQPWRDMVAYHAKSQCPNDWDTTGPMRVIAAFYLPRPKNHYGAKGVKPSAPWWPVTKPDLDKFCRSLLDALTIAGIWRDDSQAVQLHALKQYHNGAGLLACAIETVTEKGNDFA